MEVLSSRILLRPSNPELSRRFYRDLLGLAVSREFGPPEDPGMVFFLGQGLLEASRSRRITPYGVTQGDLSAARMVGGSTRSAGQVIRTAAYSRWWTKFVNRVGGRAPTERAAQRAGSPPDNLQV